jgi:hypothetical protein
MKRFTLLVAGALLAALLGPGLAPAGAGGTASVTIVHAATYDYPGASFTVTLCVDDTVVDESFEVGGILGPRDLPAGDHLVEITIGEDEGCASPDLAETITVAAGDDVTVAAIWTSNTEGPGLVVWPNDDSCIDPGLARVTVRHGAYTGGPVDVLGTIDGEEVPLIQDLDEGEQASVDAPAGVTVEDVRVVPAGGDTTLIPIGDVSLDEGLQYVVYAAGGADGAAGVFVDEIEEEICEEPVPTTQTTVAPTTVTTAPPAGAVVAEPRFTG